MDNDGNFKPVSHVFDGDGDGDGDEVDDNDVGEKDALVNCDISTQM